MHVRLETWLPFAIQVCLNGREYLARRLERAGIGFQKRDNCFVRIDDVGQGPGDARRLGRPQVGPLPERPGGAESILCSAPRRGWICTATTGPSASPKCATDVMFRDAKALDAVYPRLVSHAM